MTRALLCCAALLVACGPDLATRYETGNRALSHGDGAMYFVVISPHLQRALNDCVPRGTPDAAPMLVLVADIDPAGRASNVDVQPSSPGTRCLRERFSAMAWPRPPLQTGMQSFPLGLKIETR
jgi:hypothetical protein